MSSRSKRWILVLSIALVVCTSAVGAWIYRLFADDLDQPPGLCLSNRFPGRSISLLFETEPLLSIFDKNDFESGNRELIYRAFEEDSPTDLKPDQSKSSDLEVDEMYRFFWLRTFHEPFLFRIYRSGGQFYLVAKRTDGKAGYEFGNLVTDTTRTLRDSEWCEFVRLLDQADFWNMDRIKVETLAHDGSFWVMEGFRESRYFVAGQQSPAGGDFREACIYLMKLSGIKVDENSAEFY